MGMRPNRAEVVAITALVVAMGSGGIAAVGELRRGRVTEAAIQDRAVSGRKLADGAVGARSIGTAAVISSKIAQRAIRLDHLSPNSVATAAIAPANVTWGKLSPDVQSFIRSRGQFRVLRNPRTATLSANGSFTLMVGCATGELLVGGGFSVPPGVAVLRSSLGQSLQQWVVTLVTGAASADVVAYATCLAR